MGVEFTITIYDDSRHFPSKLMEVIACDDHNISIGSYGIVRTASLLKAVETIHELQKVANDD